MLLAGLTALALLTGPWLVAHALRRPLAAASALAIAAACVAPVSVGGWPDPRWRYVLCDVGQGDGMVLRTGPSAAVVVDVGPAPAPIARCLDRLGQAACVLRAQMNAAHAQKAPAGPKGERSRLSLPRR